MRRRADPKERMTEILAAAVKETQAGSYQSVSILKVAARAGCSRALVHSYYNTVTQLRRAVMRYAIKNELSDILAQGLAIGDPTAKKAPDRLKDKALETLR